MGTFTVAAHDVGPHLNLLDLFRVPGTRAAVLASRGAIGSEFNYTRAEHWIPGYRAALRSSASIPLRYLMVTIPVVLSCDVRGFRNDQTGMLAAAGSDLTRPPPRRARDPCAQLRRTGDPRRPRIPRRGAVTAGCDGRRPRVDVGETATATAAAP